MLTIRDVSKIREHAKLSADNKLLHIYSSSMSHELLTPLKCVKQMTEDARYKVGKNSEISYELDLIQNAS